MLSKRPDGYHDLRMIMQSVTLADRLTLEETGAGEVQVRTDLHFLPTGEKNLAAQAAPALLAGPGAAPPGAGHRH